MPWPTPAAECRLTKPTLPVAWAYPSAMPTHTASCRPSTYWMSLGKSRNMGSSVEPGLPKMVSTPNWRSTSYTPSRTVKGVGETGLMRNSCG